MKLGIAVLVAAYVMSQFYRAFLAVLSGVLGEDIGATPDDLALASGMWFLAFAAMQIPVGAALDRIGPKLTSAVLLAIGGGGGAALFAMATAPWHLSLAMALIGVGCSPVLMASYYIFARLYAPAVFATLAGAVIGVGSLGNIAGAAPLGWAVDAWGWRETIGGLAVVTMCIAALIVVTVKEPEKVQTETRGSVLELFRMPALWPILLLMLVAYAPSAGIRGLWAGPYARDVFGADDAMIGSVTLVMALSMVAGSFAYGPMDRVFGTRKWVVWVGNLVGLTTLGLLWAGWVQGLWAMAALLAVVGFTGASFPLIMAHGRAFVPPHLMGRGVTLINLFGIAGVGIMQVVTGRLHRQATEAGLPAETAYGQVFLAFAVTLALGLLVYLFARDRTD